ncbi:MAG: helix-turn-helix domain-containing protein [Ruminococcaceae bacterium]|nr:helix-turn-helix domain-containing protein [Oscillospiraceae bacterium]
MFMKRREAKVTFGEKIQLLRKSAGLSQSEFAEKIEISRQSVSKWESDVCLPDTEKVILISHLFSVSIDDLLDENREISVCYYDNNGELTGSACEAADSEEQVSDFEPFEPEVSVPGDSKIRIIKSKKTKKILAAIVAFCVLCAAVIIPFSIDEIKEIYWKLCGGKVQYSYVLVHGLGGWGEGTGINDVVKYWGAETGDLAEHLRRKGFDVHTPSVGPVSSTWDRACELYAQLTGTTVDYGAAHAEKHNHERFGRTYITPLIENWGDKINGGQRVKINLIGHSFGGETVRMLASLLAFGDEDEMNSGAENISPLFTGGKGDWVNSVTTLCSPHNGSSLTAVIDSVGSIAGANNTTDLVASLCFALAGITNPINGTYDFMLDQFGITEINGGMTEVKGALESFMNSDNDHAGYDLSPGGAAVLNSKIKLVEDVYYFSYSFCTTKENSLSGNQVPKTATLPVLYPFAFAMGSYKGKTHEGIEIDKSWQANDGLVNVISAQYPFSDEHIAFDAKAKTPKGIWNVMETLDGHHGTVIGLGAETAETHAFYENMFFMIDSLKR